MSRILFTGSTTGVGHATARSLLDEGHEVIVHARSTRRLSAAQDLLERGARSVIGDLAVLEEVHGLAEQADAYGPFDSVIHNAGVIEGPALLPVNVVAPYVLSASIRASGRLIYLSSSMHRGGRPDLTGADWAGTRTTRSYSDSKLFVTALMAGIARLRPQMPAHAVNSGWVPTRMGGPMPVTTSRRPTSRRRGSRPHRIPRLWSAGSTGITGVRRIRIPQCTMSASRTRCSQRSQATRGPDRRRAEAAHENRPHGNGSRRAEATATGTAQTRSTGTTRPRPPARGKESSVGVTYDFTGKTAFVTGASKGMGAATARAFAVAGAAVAIVDRDAEAAQEFTAELNAAGHSALALPCDVADEAQVASAVAGTVEEFGSLDMAYNNAGIMLPPVDSADETEEAFDRIVDVNLRGVWASMKHELAQMRGQGSGAIVNCSSLGGLVGGDGRTTYHGTKHGVIGQTKSVALQYGRRGVRVNAVCPGTIDTPMVEQMMAGGELDPSGAVAAIPMGRLGRAEEVAAAVLWLCSDAASYVTGVALPVDGAHTAQ